MRISSQRARQRTFSIVGAIMFVALTAESIAAQEPYGGYYSPGAHGPHGGYRAAPTPQGGPKPYYYTHKRQAYPGRWTWLTPSVDAKRPVHRGYYNNWFQLQFRRGY